MNYLEFEAPIKTLREQLVQAKEIESKNDLDMTTTIVELEEKIAEVTKEIYGKLTAWQRVLVSRHPDRPYTLDYMEALTDGEFMELHGDRNVKDDKAMVGGLGEIDGQPVMLIGQQKGNNTKKRQYRNFGMANPQGYRKALRLMKLAEKFNKPIVTFIDTPGAFPGIEAEELGQAEAIARNLFEMTPEMLMADGMADKLLIDPPREGAFALAKALAELQENDTLRGDWQFPKRIVYVSCNPATLARDAGLFVHRAGYRCVSAGVVNMFAHTAHVESMAVFERH